MRVQPNIPQVTKADFDKQEKKKHFKVKVVCLTFGCVTRLKAFFFFFFSCFNVDGFCTSW